MEQMVDGLMGAILPVAYAWLGTLASLFRRIGIKAEMETLGPTDYGAVRTSLILGLLAGTVIGLFSDVIGWGDAHGTIPLGSTALALLAGFAADRVFVLLDTVAERVFGRAVIERPAPPPPPAFRAG
jgi:hypothetical protein